MLNKKPYKLDSIYTYVIPNIPSLSQKQNLKEQHITQILNHLDTMALANNVSLPKRAANNVFFMSFLNYNSKQDSLHTVFKRYATLRAFVRALSRQYKK